MPNESCRPTSYHAYTSRASRQGLDVEIKRHLNRFVWRYRLAKSFAGISASAVGPTLGGYEAVMKVFLAFTAYELVEKIAKRMKVLGLLGPLTGKRDAAHLAARLRANVKLSAFLSNYQFQEPLKGKVTKFFAKDHDDIVCVSRGIRNVFAHGDLTPSAIGIRTKSQKALLVDLADELLLYCDELFSDCVARV